MNPSAPSLARSASLLDIDQEPWSEAARIGDPASYLARNSLSFRYAARFLPPDLFRRVADIYAFCRFSDDLVDRAQDLSAAALRARLSAWSLAAERAYGGARSGIPFLDRVMGEMAGSGVPFRYAQLLLEGIGMDIEPPRYRDLEDLRRYTYRVAGVVGQWLTETVGTAVTPDLLERAADLGHAMQITNILRDVGEDWRQGRLYLPLDLLERHGVRPEEIDTLSREGGKPSPAYRKAMEEMMEAADGHYRRAFAAIPRLPPSFQKPVAVSALVYQGIHAVIRRNRHDNINRRAVTSRLRKMVLGWKAVQRLAAETSPQPSMSRRKPLRRLALFALGLGFAGLLVGLAAGAETGAGREPQGQGAGAHSAGAHSAGAFPAGPGESADPVPAEKAPAGKAPAGKAPATAADGAAVRKKAEADLARAAARMERSPDSIGPRLDWIRAAYVLSVTDEKKLEAARERLAVFRARATAGRPAEERGTEEGRGGDRPAEEGGSGAGPAGARGNGAGPGADRAEGDPPVALLFESYSHALTVLKAKHAFWPREKMVFLQQGLGGLDSLVRAFPEEAELRYLRLMSCYYLPFFLKRKESVREDFRALGRLLPGAAERFRPDWYLNVADFVLAKGRLPEADRKALAASRDRVRLVQAPRKAKAPG